MSAVVKRSLTIAGHRTSISLEEPFWRLLQAEAKAAGISVAALVERIDGARRDTNLSSALRIHLVTRLMEGGALRGSAAEQD
ncbi:MAG: ribbon-helix-helix domain-containing protein [Methylobacterium sp.]|jgi:predicted DNA-binding ribbon-helix-helix protein|uniref:ribbon-helix-helix domain-containing protein n=1 Tax=Rhabdaerophilum sp. TaxID=2717341 RepID=UPI0022CB8740|nr:ribbon-helix-helix domain-containing protein [Methylobacterium sp.]MCE2932168.1 ribbon-helix-helix domain-containing protein [Hyphomicrobiales bacterium]MCZ8269318.1 ribbon-helix-helix domain-containing protein [Beijerinckiaceae bacterium]MCA3635660.1 ribbon-helix-helix domain-containing protein [Methylobacterium sp.]MCA3638620.1 ribbon-helix-helix domain-containing protein [Methylobacterium sp.]